MLTIGIDHGEIFTKPWVAEFMLDLVGYCSDRDLGDLTVIEPSCGTGAFLGPMIDRLIESASRFGRPLSDLGTAIRAFDLLDSNAELARKLATTRLADAGLERTRAESLASRWITTADFLLHDHGTEKADLVVGNPPYVRIESVDDDRLARYRTRCATMRGRADLYVGFYEVGLSLLKPSGQLAFICADRWMRNQYGATLRDYVTSAFAVDTVVSMHDVDAFEADVAAYPAVIAIRNGPQRQAVVVETSADFGPDDTSDLLTWITRPRAKARRRANYDATRLEGWRSGRDLWPAGSPAQLSMLNHLEREFAPLEDRRTGTRVGIGIATGCDDVYITANPSQVESDRLLPLLRSSDLSTGKVNWGGNYLVNPWENGSLVQLTEYPRLEEYLSRSGGRLRGRHVAARQPASWYRTIDKVDPDLATRPKLLLPDMKSTAHPVLDSGTGYPDHNLYFVVSDAWDLEVLGGLLISEVTNLFVGAYCVRMRGGCYRFQAQYVRRIRVPDPAAITTPQSKALARAFRRRDVRAATAAACAVYSIDDIWGGDHR